MVVILADGDISKRDHILDNYTLKDVRPYYWYKIRDLQRKEAVFAFLAGDSYKPYYPEVYRKKPPVIGRYCRGKYVKWCRGTFGADILEEICRRCPDG